jgi:hypothetical protein
MIRITEAKRKARAKQDQWFRDHKTIRISNEAHEALLRYAGMLQMESGKDTTASDAIIHLVLKIEEELKGR